MSELELDFDPTPYRTVVEKLDYDIQVLSTNRSDFSPTFDPTSDTNLDPRNESFVKYITNPSNIKTAKIQIDTGFPTGYLTDALSVKTVEPGVPYPVSPRFSSPDSKAHIVAVERGSDIIKCSFIIPRPKQVSTHHSPKYVINIKVDTKVILSIVTDYGEYKKFGYNSIISNIDVLDKVYFLEPSSIRLDQFNSALHDSDIKDVVGSLIYPILPHSFVANGMQYYLITTDTQDWKILDANARPIEDDVGIEFTCGEIEITSNEQYQDILPRLISAINESYKGLDIRIEVTRNKVRNSLIPIMTIKAGNLRKRPDFITSKCKSTCEVIRNSLSPGINLTDNNIGYHTIDSSYANGNSNLSNLATYGGGFRNGYLDNTRRFK